MCVGSNNVWEVSSASKDGVVVRTGRDASSAEVPDRLPCGAIVEELERAAGCIHYMLLSEEGPVSGWINLTANGKDLLAKTTKPIEEAEVCIDAKTDSSRDQQEVEDEDRIQDADMALLMYSQHLAQEREEEFSGKVSCLYDETKPDRHWDTNYERRTGPSAPPPLFSAESTIHRKAPLHILGSGNVSTLTPNDTASVAESGHVSAPSEKIQTTGAAIQAKKLKAFTNQCVDMDLGHLCPHCRLPTGDVGHYTNEGQGPLIHGECMAQLIVQSCMEESAEQLARDATLKSERREAYDIGWRLDHIPENVAPAAMLGCKLVPQGMCGLLLQNGLRDVSVVPTIAPAAAVNLEYLSIALRVRQTEGREPIFSLDPVENKNSVFDKDAMQVKRFEPEWLAGTSVGDVLFQSDYHLKELSMGEYDQPIVGMKSIHEYSNASEHSAGKWSAREWFHIRDARVNMSQDNVLIPFVKMGVEAREQVYGLQGYEDLPITRKDHPMAQYAEAFTRNFDLIAERKSVVYHLRELAKASVIAKFLVESQMTLSETWYNLAPEAQDCCSMEIPQLWNERITSRIEMKDGEIVRSDCPKRGVYGGVQFGLEKFQISQARAKKVKPVLIGEGTGMGGLEFGLDRFDLSQKTARPVLAQPGAVGFRQNVKALSAVTAKDTAATKMLRSQTGSELKIVPITLPGFEASTAPGAGGVVVPSAGAAPGAAPAGAQFQVFTAPRRVTAVLGPATRSATGKIKGITPLKKVAGPPMVTPGITAGLSAAAMPSTGLSAVGRMTPATGISSVGLGRLGRPSIGAARPGLLAAPRVHGMMGSTTDRQAALQGPPRIFGVSQQPAITHPFSDQPSLTQPQGVDLNLDQFNLSTVEQLKTGGAVQMGTQEKSIAISDSFWLEVDGRNCESVFAAEDKQMLSDIFNPFLSDRREEGAYFAPPDTSSSYISKLRALLKEERCVQDQRQQHFFSCEFQVDNAGPLFPLAWTSPYEITSETMQRCTPNMLHARPDYIQRAGEIVKSAAAQPIFDKCTEDGTRFRIYRVGSLEVRSIQAYDQAETVGVVFTIRKPSSFMQERLQEMRRVVKDSECISKVTEYVEPVQSKTDKFIGGTGHGALYDCCYYTVIETREGNVVVTEKVNGAVAWEENPVDLEDRNSLAKVLRAGDCSDMFATVQDLKSFCTQPTLKNRAGRLYAQDVFVAAMGGIEKVTEAYLQKQARGHSRAVPEQLDAADPTKEAVQTTRMCQCCSKMKEKEAGRMGAPGSGLEDTWACNSCWKDLKQ